MNFLLDKIQVFYFYCIISKPIWCIIRTKINDSKEKNFHAKYPVHNGSYDKSLTLYWTSALWMSLFIYFSIDKYHCLGEKIPWSNLKNIFIQSRKFRCRNGFFNFATTPWIHFAVPSCRLKSGRAKPWFVPLSLTLHVQVAISVGFFFFFHISSIEFILRQIQ